MSTNWHLLSSFSNFCCKEVDKERGWLNFCHSWHAPRIKLNPLTLKRKGAPPAQDYNFQFGPSFQKATRLPSALFRTTIFHLISLDLTQALFNFETVFPKIILDSNSNSILSNNYNNNFIKKCKSWERNNICFDYHKWPLSDIFHMWKCVPSRKWTPMSLFS